MSRVVIEKVNNSDYRSLLNDLLDKLGGLNKFISPGDKVFIKPNMFIEAKPESALITHPALVLAMAELCKELGAVVIIGERNGSILRNFNEFPKIHQIAKVIDLDCEEVILKGPVADNLVINFPLPIPRVIEEADVVINMPGLRTHVLTKFSNALKNLMGYLPGNVTRIIHLAGLEEAIIDLNKLFRVDLHVSDAIYSLQGSFPATKGSPVNTNFVMASTDPVALDTIAAEIIGYKVKDIDLLSLANKAGLGENDPAKIEVIGEQTGLNYNLLKPLEEKALKELNCKIYSEQACEKCQRALVNGIYAFLEEHEIDELNEIKIITGKSYYGTLDNDNNLIYGNCAKSYFQQGKFIPGCPPLTGAVKKGLEELIAKK